MGSLGSEQTEGATRDEVALEIEGVVDRSLDREEALG